LPAFFTNCAGAFGGELAAGTAAEVLAEELEAGAGREDLEDKLAT